MRSKAPTTTKAKAPKIKALKSCKSYEDKLVYAIRELREHKGSSRAAIAKFIKASFDGAVNAAALRKALKKGVSDGSLVQAGQSFRISMEEYEADPELVVVQIDDKVGEGVEAVAGTIVHVKYIGTLQDGGEEFDAADEFSFTLGAGDVVKGWDVGLVGMRVGGVRQLVVPSKLGYGKKGSGRAGEPGSIPPNATLCFTVTLKQVEQ